MSDELVPYPADEATAGVFRSLAQIVYASDDFTEVYDAVVHAAPRLVDGLRPRQPDAARRRPLRHRRRRATTSPSTIDELERELGEGPCLDAIVDESVYHDADLTDGSPWPRLAERVLASHPGARHGRLPAARRRARRPAP